MKLKRIKQSGLTAFNSHMFTSQLFTITLDFKLINYFIKPASLLKIVTLKSLKMNPDVVASLTFLGLFEPMEDRSFD